MQQNAANGKEMQQHAPKYGAQWSKMDEKECKIAQELKEQALIICVAFYLPSQLLPVTSPPLTQCVVCSVCGAMGSAEAHLLVDAGWCF